MINDLNIKNKYVVACSFGPDSMALLDIVFKAKIDIVVAHVNYHKRDVSNDEEKQLKKYCKQKNIPLEVLDTKGMICSGNFQKWARNLRYDFFKNVLRKYNASGVLVAHQQDDLIETYIMQKKRHAFVKYWGIADKNLIMGIEIIRPLLHFSKADLLKYDIENNVPFSIDVSNLTNDYERNRIRHAIVEKMSSIERANIIKEINEKNAALQKTFQDFWTVDEFLNLSDEQITHSISNFLDFKGEHTDLSIKFVREIRKAINSNKKYVSIQLTNKICLIKNYDEVLFNSDSIDYLYSLDERAIIDDDLFYIDFNNGKEERNIHKNDYPLTIKPVGKNDYIKIKNYDCEIRRLFIDWKLPHRYRDCWPGIYNKDGKLIYVPRYRKKFCDNHSSKFIIKFTK